MPELRYADLFSEVYELCHDLVQDINQQLVYFRASVYKNETADLIRDQITALRGLTDLIGDDLLCEPFYDYEAELKNLVVIDPGECTFSSRVARLTQRLAQGLAALKEKRWQEAHQDKLCFEEHVQKNRKKILSLATPGSRLWNFFHSL